MKRVLWMGVFVFVAILLVVAAIMGSRQKSAPIIVTAFPYTSTPRPSQTPTTAPHAPGSSLPGCLWWYELRPDQVGMDVCVLGLVRTIVSNDPNSKVVRIYLKADLPKGYTRKTGAPKDFYFFDESYSYTDIRTDDCVTASGILSMNNDGIPFMRLDGNLQKCP
jgi:hypothetical protein